MKPVLLKIQIYVYKVFEEISIMPDDLNSVFFVKWLPSCFE